MTSLTGTDALSVVCPSCGAAVGSRCLWDGVERAGIHAMRRRKAAKGAAWGQMSAECRCPCCGRPPRLRDRFAAGTPCEGCRG